ncbi:SLBB domain-containing protein [Sulfurihydrogenibium yellowstonense]|uniref:Polysaccharide biosynthesis protein n=1 Tax=Sulfurihydrogenibium yellowstonense SS-5 TaxID=432331 RepID=C4FKG3_9AQUI|nr:SLBB domain-containing protein [Sulfurihydrogenibium yellowstonense]EEP60439.1 polysaccharide biosynthesis protein [Sulfurihydrogenibium yellowstonense SS-5]
MKIQLRVLFFIISIFSFLYAQEGGGISLPSQNTGNVPYVNLPPSEVLQKLKENQNILKENKTIINKEQIQNQLTGLEENQENEQFKEEVKQTETNNLAAKESSELETNINNLFKDILKNKKLEQFGYNFFKKSTKSISPVGDDYILGPGDSLKVYVWGDPVDLMAINRDFSLKVSSDGTVYVPNVGMLQVSGLTLGDFKKLITSKLSSKFKNLKVDATVEKIRKFNIYLTGFVNSPGMKTVDALDTLVDALIFAEGVSKNGSLRNIEIKRKTAFGISVIKVDLYDLFIKGYPIDIKLKDGDVIYVPPIGNVVAIAGEVKRPAIYELKNENSLDEILEFAGGINPSSSEVFVRLMRYSKDGIVIKEGALNDKTFLKTRLENGDFVLVGKNPGVLENGVDLTGEVYYPGIYSINDTPDLKTLIEKAKPLVNAKSIVITDVKKQQFYTTVEDVLYGKSNYKFSGKEKVAVLSKFLEEPVYITGEIEESKTIQYYPEITLLDVIKDIKFQDKIENLKVRIYNPNEDNNVKELSIENQSQKKEKIELKPAKIIYLYDLLIKGIGNIKLKPGTIVMIVKKDKNEKAPSVIVTGEVVNPGKYEIEPGKTTLYDVLKLAGGYRENAFPQGLIFIRESTKRLQEEKLETTLAILEEEIIKSKNRYAFSDEAESKAAMMAIQDQARQIELLKKKALLGLGRISLDIPPLLEDLKNSNQNITLEDGDTIIVPPKPNYVLVLGDVYNQISLPYIKDYRLKDYLDMVGGPTRTGNLNDLYIIKANGRIVSAQNYGGRFLLWSGIMDYKLSEGDTIVVPTELKIPIMWRPLLKDIVQIIFQSISTAVLAKRL